MTPHKHAAIIKAWADGAQIQVKTPTDKYWEDLLTSFPTWLSSFEYRVKTEPVKTLGYRRYIGRYNKNCPYFVGTISETGGADPVAFARTSLFVKWIDTEWQYETVDHSV